MSDAKEAAKEARRHPDVDKLLRQFLRLESGVDTKRFNLRHIYMEPCGNPACSPHLTDAERSKVDRLGEDGCDFEEAVLAVLGRR